MAGAIAIIPGGAGNAILHGKSPRQPFGAGTHTGAVTIPSRFLHFYGEGKQGQPHGWGEGWVKSWIQQSVGKQIISDWYVIW